MHRHIKTIKRLKSEADITFEDAIRILKEQGKYTPAVQSKLRMERTRVDRRIEEDQTYITKNPPEILNIIPGKIYTGNIFSTIIGYAIPIIVLAYFLIIML